MALEAQFDTDTFNERIAGIPAPPKGRVHAEFRMTTHCQHVEFDPTKVIHVWIDPGFSRLTDSAYSVLAAQMHHVGEQPQIRIFDEIYAQETYGEAIIQTLKNRPWWNAAPMKAVIDQGGAQHAAIASQADVWVKEAGLMPFYQPVGLLEGIRRVNSFMKVDPISGEPGILIDPRCKGLLSELGGLPNPFGGGVKVYRWEVGHDGTVMGNTPRDAYNHSSKALAYGVVANFRFDSGNGGRTTIPIRRYGYAHSH